ncbi:MAG: hypothetical protein FJ109_17090, partial [Deltaproteobacteria bacterium]|nr:hypothetical protein [Deltaproteobacteria bacterium]
MGSGSNPGRSRTAGGGPMNRDGSRRPALQIRRAVECRQEVAAFRPWRRISTMSSRGRGQGRIPEVVHMLPSHPRGCYPNHRGMLARATVCALLAAALVLQRPLPAHADTWTTPHPGVKHVFKKTNMGGPLEVFGLVVDLCEPGVTPRATAPGEKKKKTSSFGSLVGAQAAINGDFFSYENYMTTGYSVGNGEVWAGTGDSGWQSVVAFGKYHAYFSDEPEVFKAQWWTTEAVSGFAQIMKDGEAIASYSCAGHFCQKHPRTAVGLSKDRRTLYLLVVDGRTDISVGVTLKELAVIIKDLGAHDAVNLDGGGSSTMWVQNGGILNNPSDGPERVVANHLAVHASGSGQPGACGEWPPEQVMIDSALFDAAGSTDVDGDGLADFCARAAAGLLCALSGQNGLSKQLQGPHPELSDDLGWNHPSHYGTIHMGDIDGDTLADVCARGNSGIRCWRSTGDGFDDTAILGPAWSDAAGWENEKHFSTIRMLDVDGDGLADLCGRGPGGIECYRSLGNGFEDGFAGPQLSDDQGWGKPEYFGTIRSGDIDGDGKHDLCARGAAGFMCWLSTGVGYGEAIGGPTWNDAGGWSEMRYWETIRLADINGDGRDDLCARGPAGIECYASIGNGFSPAVPGPTLSDDSGWHDQTNYLPIRLGDINGDGMADVCARANAGIRCWHSLGDGFGPQLNGPELSDGNQWFRSRYYNSLRLADLDGDGLSDLCARTPDGVSCWLSDGDGFPTHWTGPGWGDGSGWGSIEYWSTVRLADPRPHDPCKAAGACAPGGTEVQPCGECGTSTRSCDEWCGWGDWTECLGGAAAGDAAVCDDGNVCTDDICGPSGECTSSPNSAPCDGRDLCADAVCVDGACVTQEPREGCCTGHEDCDVPFEKCAPEFHVCLSVICTGCKTNDDCGPPGNLCLAFGPDTLACGAWCDEAAPVCPA